jgi:hypothetical protein
MPTLFRRPPQRRRAMQWVGIVIAASVLAVIEIVRGLL